MPFKSKAQQRFMFAKHPRIAKRWAKETPDIKSLPDKLSDAKTAGFWAMMAKLGAIDPAIRKNVERVAKRMGVPPPSERELERMFPKGWEAASQGSWQSQFEKSEWLRDANSAKAHAKDVAAGRAPAGSAPRTSHGAGWTSVGKVPWYSKVPQAIIRQHGLYGLGGLAALTATGPAIQLAKRRARKGLTDEELDKVTRETAGLGTALGGAAGGLLGATAIPYLANLPAARAAGGWKNLFAKSPVILPALTATGVLTGLYSVPWGMAAGGAIGSRFMPGKAEKVRQEKGRIFKGAEEFERRAIPPNYLASRFAASGLLGGGVTGALEPPVRIALERLRHAKGTPKTPSFLASLIRNMPEGTRNKMLQGAAYGAISGLMSGYLTGRFGDYLIQKKLEADKAV